MMWRVGQHLAEAVFGAQTAAAEAAARSEAEREALERKVMGARRATDKAARKAD